MSRNQLQTRRDNSQTNPAAKIVCGVEMAIQFRHDWVTSLRRLCEEKLEVLTHLNIEVNGPRESVNKENESSQHVIIDFSVQVSVYIGGQETRVEICAQDLERLCEIVFWLQRPSFQNCAPFVHSHGYGPTDTNQGPNNLC